MDTKFWENFSAFASQPGTVAFVTNAADAHGQGRSHLLHQPLATFAVEGDHIWTQHGHNAPATLNGDALSRFDEFLNSYGLWQENPCHPHRLAAGYIGYEFARHCLPQPKKARAISRPKGERLDDFPDLWFAVYENQIGFQTEPPPVETCAPSPHGTMPLPSPTAYTQAVERALAFIEDGDIYQVNLAQRFVTALNPLLTPEAMFPQLCAHYPASMSAFIRLDALRTIMSLSPERFLQVQYPRICTEPIKGTAARQIGRDVETRQWLINSDKNRAELTMIVDLERNDLGKICRPGTVQVPSLAHSEACASVHHLKAEVSGTLREGLTPGDILRATFPGGSITGAPKGRAMEIIAELEGMRRNVYTGAIGYIAADRRMDFNIAIRTLIRRGGEAALYAGAGIVADSRPDLEFQETMVKVSPLLSLLHGWSAPHSSRIEELHATERPHGISRTAITHP